MAEANLDMALAEAPARAGLATSRVPGVWRITRDFCRRRPLAAFAAVFIAIVLAAAIFAPALAPYDPNKQSLATVLQPPGNTRFAG